MTDFDPPPPDPMTETSATPTPTQPVGAAPVLTPADAATTGSAGTAPAATAPRRSRARWAVAALVVALVVGASAVIGLALASTSKTSMVLGYAPSDAVAYAEVRLDLPGDQRQQVAAFLSHFPGFADQAALPTKINETLDQLVGKATDGKQTYTKDIEPWFSGQVAYVAGPLPASISTDAPQMFASTRLLLLASVKDAALAKTWVGNALTQSGATTTSETYGSTELTIVSAKDMADAKVATAIVDGKVLAVGDVTSVKAAIDSKGAGTLGSAADFQAAVASNPGDHVGFSFVRVKALVDRMSSLAGDAAGVQAAGISSAVTGLLPEWMSARLRVESDALVVDGSAPHVDGAPGPTGNHANAVAGFAPPSTVMLAAGNDAGATVKAWVDHFRADPKLAEQFTQLDQAIGLVGGWDGLLGWMGDTGVVVATAGDGIEGGLISIPTDAAKAKQLFTTLRSAVTLGGGQLGFQVRDEDYQGTTITVIDLGSFKDLAGLAGGTSGTEVPTTMLPDGNATIAYAATDTVVVIGSSPDFVKHVLDAGAGQSLADTERYQGLVAKVAAEHTGVTFVDISAVRGLLEQHLAAAPADQKAEYEESVKPFLTPFDAFVAAGVTSTDLEHQHSRLTVK